MLGIQVRNQAALELRDHIFQLKLASLQALNPHGIVMAALNQVLDDHIQVSVLHSK